MITEHRIKLLFLFIFCIMTAGFVMASETETKYPKDSAIQAIEGNGVIFSYDDYTVWLVRNGEIISSYPASGSAKGLGEIEGSNQTPRGLHTVCQIIGGDGPYNTRYVSRKPVGQVDVYQDEKSDPGENVAVNFILTGIIWITGEQTPKERYVYVHSTNRLWAVGKKHISHGCILLLPEDLLELMKQVNEGTKVYIY